MYMLVIKQKYVIAKLVVESMDFIPPMEHDYTVEDTNGSVGIGAYHEAQEGIFWMPLNAAPVDTPAELSKEYYQYPTVEEQLNSEVLGE